MKRCKVHISAAILVITLLISSCAGIEPYDPPDDKEEPPVNGLLTGEDGEFIIFLKNAEGDTNSEKIQNNNQ